jgi:hypothetical protein
MQIINISVTLRTNWLLDFVYRPDKILKYNIKSRRFGSWSFFRLQVMGGETTTQMGPLDRAKLNRPVIEISSV